MCNWKIVIFSGFVIGLPLTCGFAATQAPIEPHTPRTIADIETIFEQTKPDLIRLQEAQTLLQAVAPEGANNLRPASFYKKKALAAQSIGNMTAFVENMQKVVALGGDTSIYEDLFLLGQAKRLSANFKDAIEALNQALDEVPKGIKPGIRATLFGYLGQAYLSMGDLNAAESNFKNSADEIAFGRSQQYSPRYSHLWTFSQDILQGDFLLAQGKLAEAKVLFSHCVSDMPATIEEVRREQRGKGEGVSQPDAYYHFVANNARSKLALIRLKQGRLTDAEVFAREALLDSLKDSGHYSFYTAALVSPLVQVLMHQGRFSEAERLSNAGTQIYVAIGTPQDSVWVRNLRLQIAGIRIAQERYAEALAEYDSIYQSFSNSSKAQALIAQGSLGWALALVKTGRPADALSVLNRLIPLTKQFLGDRHIDYAELMGVRAMALQLLDRNLEALDAFRFVSPLLLYEDAAGGSDTSVIRATYRTLILESYLKLLGDLHSVGTIVSSGLNAPKESFKLADALRSLRTQRALSASAVRTAAQDEKMGIDIRRQQDLEQEEIGLYQLLGEMINLAPDQQASDAIADLRKRIVAVGQARKQLESEIRKRFPAYDNLLHPASPDVVDVQTAMHADEAVVNIFTTDSGTYVWAFRKDGETAFVRSALSKRDLRTLVRSIRKSLDPGAVDISKNLPDFDVNAGYRIFSELLVPVAAGWRGAAQMIVSSNDALSQLPLAVLPTTMAAVGTRTRLTYENHRALPWLIQQLAISQVPSVNSLLSLRNMQSGKLDRQSFIGFGDPQFALDAAPVQPNNGLRNLDIPRPSASELSTRKALKWLDYSVLPALPDTRDEVLSIARSLKADTDKDVYLGKQASRANVMSLDLSKRRVVAFATHGLLPGDFPGVMVPSLALANPGGGQYGLLTLEDILTLKLDADWVVLSACNTGSGEGQGSEALSGLARGFFYAGSRTLLVTMWPVESGSARLLVTGLFERLVKGQASVSRAEALRQSILALMQQSDAEQHVSYAHPLFWAPYVVVGEGGP